MFIINAPTLFSGIWAMVKPWVDKKTRKKVHILGSGYYKELEKYISPENIPDFFGGKADTTKLEFFSNPGPWNDYGKEKLFPETEEEIVGLRKLNHSNPNLNLNPNQEEQAMLDICEPEPLHQNSLKELKTFFTKQKPNWSISKESLTFHPNPNSNSNGNPLGSSKAISKGNP